MLCSVVLLYCVLLCCVSMLCYIVLCCILLCCAVILCFVILCCYCVVLCSIVLYCVVFIPVNGSGNYVHGHVNIKSLLLLLQLLLGLFPGGKAAGAWR